MAHLLAGGRCPSSACLRGARAARGRGALLRGFRGSDPRAVHFLPIATSAGLRRAAGARAPGGADRGDCRARPEGILAPSFVPGVPEAASTPAYIVLGIGLLFYAALAVCAGRTFLLTRRFADMAVVYGLVLLAVALVPGLLMRYYELGWWLGHAWELIGIGLVGVPWRSTCTAARSHARSWATCARASW